MQKEYDIVANNDDGEYAGSIFGYVADEIHCLKNYLEKHGYGYINLDKYKGCDYGIICSMFVEKPYRNEGIGNKLMDDIIYRFRKVHNVDCIFLVSDGLENNDFNLQEWYESWGFDVLEDRDKCPLMIA